MEAVKAKDEWLNSKWSAQNKLADHQDPAVYASVILSEKKVNACRHIRALVLPERFSICNIRVLGIGLELACS